MWGVRSRFSLGSGFANKRIPHRACQRGWVGFRVSGFRVWGVRSRFSLAGLGLGCKV